MYMEWLSWAFYLTNFLFSGINNILQNKSTDYFGNAYLIEINLWKLESCANWTLE